MAKRKGARKSMGKKSGGYKRPSSSSRGTRRVSSSRSRAQTVRIQLVGEGVSRPVHPSVAPKRKVF